MKNAKKELVIALSVIGVGMSSMPIVYAQAGALEEIVVTARKREESLQDMAQSVSVVTAGDVENRFADDIRDIVDISPNLIIDDTAQGPGGVAAIFIRGVGISEVESSFDPAVGVVVDDIFLGKASGSIAQLVDVESIEVLRGPQGTLFGRNAIGGVINIKRKKPTQDLTGTIRAGVSNYDKTKLDTYASFGLTEDLAVKVNYSNNHQREGFYDNLVTGDDDGEIEYEMYGVHFLWTPKDTLDIEYSFFREEYDQDTPPLVNVTQGGELFCDAFGFCSPDLDTPVSGDRFDVIANGPNDSSFEADTHRFSVDWRLNERYSVDYIFGYRETDETSLQDFDATSLTLFETSRPEKFDQTSHELRLNFDGDRLDYVLGGYLYEQEYTVETMSFIGFIVPDTVIPVPNTITQETDSYAAFFEADYRLTETLVLNVGGRYGNDDKSSQANSPGIVMDAPVSDSWSEFTPKVGLSWFFRDDVMAYALFSTGYRSGGFPGLPGTQSVAETSYDPETVNNFEIGFKSEWLNRRLRMNMAVFLMDYEDKQEEQNVRTDVGTGVETPVSNVSDVTIAGAEFEVTYLPGLEGLQISGNVGLLDAEYDGFVANIGRGGVTDNDDLELRRAPELTAGMFASYEWGVMQGFATARAGWHFIGEHQTSLLNSPETANDDQHLINASLSYQQNRFKVSIFGKNLSDEDGYSVGFDVGGQAAGALWTYATPRPPRTYGLEFEYSF